MSEQTLFEKLGVQYREKDGIFYPLITVEIKEEDTDIGKYGLLWMKYIQSEYPQRYRSLVRFGELHSKAIEVNEVAYELLEDIENEWFKKHKPRETLINSRLFL
ncbi:MAG: TnpV protein [Lachnospiraceae bacterium]|nr:TnpV protein [Lachnospiraceae bacterium]